MKGQSDHAKQTAYAWEKDLFTHCSFTKFDSIYNVELFVIALCVEFGMEPIDVRNSINRRTGGQSRLAYANCDRLMVLPQWAWTDRTILHEFAHNLSWKLNIYPYRGGHQPIWLSIFILLMERYMRIDRKDLLASVRAFKTEYFWNAPLNLVEEWVHDHAKAAEYSSLRLQLYARYAARYKSDPEENGAGLPFYPHSNLKSLVEKFK